MNFTFSEELELLRRVARDLLDRHASLDEARAALDGGPTDDAALWKLVVDQGWPGTAVPSGLGGDGGTRLALCVLAEELGRAVARLPFAPSVYEVTEAVARFGSEDQQRRFLPVLVGGALIGTAALVPAEGVAPGGGTEEFRFDLDRARGHVPAVAYGDRAGILLAVAETAAGPTAVLADLTTPAVTARALPVFDPGWPLADLLLDGVPAEPLGQPGQGARVAREVSEVAAVYLAFEALGGAQRCLEDAAEYARQRFQFGRAIGSFQAVKHRLADVFAAVELARSHCYYAAWALEASPADLPVAAAQARLAAGEAYRAAAEEGLHIHGGMGFTWAADAHLFVRRARALEAALGGPTLWSDRLVEHLVAETGAG